MISGLLQGVSGGISKGLTGKEKKEHQN